MARCDLQLARGEAASVFVLVTTATALLAINASSRKNPNSATLSGSEIKKLNFGGKQRYAATKALTNESDANSAAVMHRHHGCRQ